MDLNTEQALLIVKNSFYFYTTSNQPIPRRLLRKRRKDSKDEKVSVLRYANYLSPEEDFPATKNKRELFSREREKRQIQDLRERRLRVYSILLYFLRDEFMWALSYLLPQLSR